MRKQKISKKAISMKKAKFLLIALCAIMFVQCYCNPTVSKAADSLTHTVYNGQVAVEFIDVASRSNGGKADATLIATKSGSSIVYTLVDCGTAESSNYLLHRLSERGVKTIESLILTHNHTDHVGGLESLLKSNIKVKNIYMNERGEEKTNKVKNIIKKYYGSNFPINSYNKMKKIVNINTGTNSSAKIKLYTCNHNFTDNMDNLNDNSLVVEVVGNNFSCILFGDLREKGLKGFQSTYGDKLMIKNNIHTLNNTYTVVKVGHHGYRKSFTKSEIEREAEYYVSNFPASNYVFTATPDVFENKEKLKKFTNILNSKWTMFGWSKCWLHSSTAATNSEYSTQPVTSFGNWSCMQ